MNNIANRISPNGATTYQPRALPWAVILLPRWGVGLSLTLLASLFWTSTNSSCFAQDQAEVEVAAAAALAAPEDPQLQVLKRYVTVNCAFARRVCALSQEQEQFLAKMEDEWIAAKFKQAAPAPVEGAAQGFARLFGFAQQAVPARQAVQPHEQSALVKKLIDTQIESALDGSQVAMFQREREARDTFRRQAIAGVIVSILDKRLFLTEDQRVALEKAVADGVHKDLAWSIYLMNDNYVPVLHGAFAKVLDKKQMAALSGFTQNDFEMAQFQDQLGNFRQQDDVTIEK